MSETIDEIITVLRDYGIDPYADETPDFPEVGEVGPNETIYTTSRAAVDRDDNASDDELSFEDPRLHDWFAILQEIIEGRRNAASRPTESGESPEPRCAWYCPIHYFGHGWGIFIREQCVLATALDIGRHTDLAALHNLGLTSRQIGQQFLRAAFYTYFLHEQFHHKVESLGFRLLVSTSSDRYRPYKANVYRPLLMTPDCLEESLANAESFLRMREDRYLSRLASPIRAAYAATLKASFALQPPGYREALNYLTEPSFRLGQQTIHSAMLDAKYPPSTPANRWSVAPQMIRALMNIDADIYVIIPVGTKPLFTPTTIDPGVTISTARATSSLVKKHGYSVVAGGGKGSHVKLQKAGANPITLKANQHALTPGLLRKVLSQLGDYPLSRARDIL